jgi:hypothetical protein
MPTEQRRWRDGRPSWLVIAKRADETVPKGGAFMKQFLSIVGITLGATLLLSSCGSAASPSQQASTQRPTVQQTPASTTIVETPAGCSITPIHMEPYSGSGSGSDPVGIPWAQADPASSGITAFLFYASSDGPFLHTGGQFPNGTNDKILWVIENPQAADEVEISGKALSNPSETFDQTFPVAASPTDDYPSIIEIPAPGCWQVTITSGPVTGTMTVWVIDN